MYSYANHEVALVRSMWLNVSFYRTSSLSLCFPAALEAKVLVLSYASGSVNVSKQRIS